MTLTTLSSNQQLLVFNQRITTNENPLSPFAYTDLLTHLVSQTGLPMLHFWESQPLVILGMKDTRVPNLTEGLKYLTEQNYRYLARNSGGLAVVADDGVLNISLFLTTTPTRTISIDEAYQLMHQLISHAFADFPVKIEAKEISDSYCPGEYDLSIKGQKFAGIAQRRIKQGIAVMIYLSVTGNQKARGHLIHNFYQRSLQDYLVQQGYPIVTPASMANLDDLLETTLTINHVKERFTAALEEHYHLNAQQVDMQTFMNEQQLTSQFNQHLTKMERRNLDSIPIGVE